jgi:uncharacterized protein (TIGR00290 family)
MEEKAVVSWSGGKDSALALFLAQADFEIAGLLTTVTDGFDRISIHGVRTGLLERQAQSLNLPLQQVVIPQSCSNAEYEARMCAALEENRRLGVTRVICGDIFLEDVRRYREERLFQGLKGVFPLWRQNTTELAGRFQSLGFEAIVCCVDTAVLDRKFTGRNYDRQFVADLPAGIDPCGENGEFHTFVIDGPNMTDRLHCRLGDVVLREERFCYCDLLPAAAM